jgi:hypothetical protein
MSRSQAIARHLAIGQRHHVGCKRRERVNNDEEKNSVTLQIVLVIVISNSRVDLGRL